MESRDFATISPAEKRHMTEVPGECSVKVGYNSSSAGTKSGRVNDGGAAPTVAGLGVVE